MTTETAISNSRRWGIVALLFVASLINYLDRATISVALPLISVSLNLAAATKGLLLSAFFCSYALMQVPVGWCVDRYNLRWIYSGLFALWSLACGLTGFAAKLGRADSFPRSAWDWRVDLPSRGDKDRQRSV